jgi:7-cyano-7-deazaguanine reductase
MKDEAKPELTLLGSQRAFPTEPDTAILETFPNRNPARSYWIKLDCMEFSSLCPVTGQPDYARVRLEYVPDERCVETKSLKYYLASYRNTAAFNEEIINRIADDLIAVCRPRQMWVQGEFAPRGGIGLTVEVRHPEP